MIWHSTKEKIKILSENIITAQSPIRILDSIKHDQRIYEAFKKSGYKEIPQLPHDAYALEKLGWSPQKKIEEFETIRKSIISSLGVNHPLKELFENIAVQYQDVCHLILNSGDRQFYKYSKKLYGSTRDCLLSDSNTIFELGQMLYTILGKIKSTLPVPENEKTISDDASLKILESRFADYFGENIVNVKISDGIVSDAAAGGDNIKLKSGNMYSKRDIDIYEVHEGWVHVGTTLNGRNQHIARWLSVGPPRCTSTQEGLAVLMEIFTFRSSVHRAQRINDRIIAIAKVEEGANLIEIFEYFRIEGYSEEECLHNTMRIFRGSPLSGGAPFTKDISYCRGFVENYNFMRTAIRANKPFLLPYLFAGKLHVEDIPLIYQMSQEGIVDFPKYLPPHFQDINGIAVWMSFSSFFNQVDLQSVQQHYNALFKKYI